MNAIVDRFLVFPARASHRALAALLSLAILAAPESARARPLFTADFYQYATDGAATLAVADVNEDGRLDFVSTNPDSHTVSVFLGDGEGAFLPRVDPAVSGTPRSIVLGLLDGDTHPDLVLVDPTAAAPRVWVYLGVGDGTFGAGTSYVAASGAMSPVLADVNGDGRLDVSVANYSTSSFSVFLGNGDGTLQAKSDHPTSPEPTQVLFGLLDGDALLDAVVASNNPLNVSVFLGTGGGNFAAPVGYSMSQINIALSDLNADGHPDLIASTKGGGSPATTVSVRLGNADGTFGARTTYPSAQGPNAMCIADMTGDGIPDMAVLTIPGLSVLPGNGSGGLGAHVEATSTTVCPSGLVVGDLDGDGHMDAAIGGYCGGMTVLLGNGGGRFGQAAPIPGLSSFNGVLPVAVGDIDEDGHLDAVSASNTNAALVTGKGLTGYSGMSQIVAPSAPFDVQISDLNADTHLDLVLGTFTSIGGGKVTVRLGNGDGTFATDDDYFLPNVLGSGYQVTIGDVNGDLISDLAATGGTSHGVSVFLGNGDGSFGGRLDVSSGNYPSGIVLGDMTNDGAADLMFVDYNTNKLTLLPSVGDGTFDPRIDFSVPTNPRAVAVGDLNGDTRPDMAVVGSAAPGQLTLVFQNNDGSFGPPRNLPFGYVTPFAVAIADVNGDSRPDVVLTSSSPGLAMVLLGHGDGTFDDYRGFGVPGSATETAIGDWSGDGFPELVVSSYNLGQLSVLYNQVGGPGPVSVPRGAAPLSFRLLAPRPNPSAAGVTIEYMLPRTGRASVEVYDASGRRVRALAGGGLISAGSHTVSWDGRDQDGARARPGIYWLSVSALGNRDAKRVVIVQ